jgi:hypothetical protein
MRTAGALTRANVFSLRTPGSRRVRLLMQGVARIPLMREFVKAVYKRYFDKAEGDVRLFRGIYADFASAARALPVGRAAGYDNEASAYRNIHEWLTISEYDYPIMLWLTKLLPECRLHFDWGGAGNEIARRESATSLEFTTTLTDLPRA